MASSIDKINALVDKYSLSETVKQECIKISKESYTLGSNNAFNALRTQNNQNNKIFKEQLQKLVEKWLS